MQLSILVACVLTLAVPQATAPTALPQKDRDAAVRYFEQTRDQFLKAIDGVSEAQWTFKAGPDRWSIAEAAEHITVSETTIMELIKGKMLTAPPPAARPATISDAELIKGMTDRSQKAQAPEMLRPTHRWATRDELRKAFLEARQKNIDYVKTTKDDLRGHFGEHPVFKQLDTYQWVLLLAAHSARHTAQIEEVKASAGYPQQ